MSLEDDVLRLLIKNNLEEKWLTINVNEEQHLPYWKLVNKKEIFMIVSQTGSRLSPMHHQRALYFYHTKYYATLKEYLQVIHKIHLKDFQK